MGTGGMGQATRLHLHGRRRHGPGHKTAFALHACEGATSPEAAGRMACDLVPRLLPSLLARASLGAKLAVMLQQPQEPNRVIVNAFLLPRNSF
jgi:hypothetical protein